MSLSPGTRLGPYEIESPIGAGGMGEVYKARDTRLDRSVAIKVLPPEFTTDTDRRARFEREARTIGGLDHPHICTLYDVGDHDGSLFLVMEHLSGQTLAERLSKGPPPPGPTGMMRVAFGKGRPGRPALLFAIEGGFKNAANVGSYDYDPETDRFLVVENGKSDREPSQIYFVQNWLEELKQKAPVR